MSFDRTVTITLQTEDRSAVGMYLTRYIHSYVQKPASLIRQTTISVMKSHFSEPVALGREASI